MQHGLFAFVLEHHLPVMRNVMFAARGRAGISYKAHGNASQNQRLHDLAYRLFITGCGLIKILRHSSQRSTHHLYDGLTVILPVDDLRHFPIRQAGIFAKDIRNARHNHGHRRLAQYLCIPNDGVRYAHLIGGF